MKSKEYYDYKATVMKKFIEKVSIKADRPQSSSAYKKSNYVAYSGYGAKRRVNDSAGQDSAYSLSTQIDSEAKSCYQQVVQTQASSSSVSSYKKYLARA